MSLRPIKSLVQSRPTIEGAGVRLHRAFGFGKTAEFDPFLLFDDFRSDNPDDYVAGFPWHPHRGIETITYVLAGAVEHEDSLGNAGRLGPGDVQWMTAGRGILHQEMPAGDPSGHMHGFQLWANLPAALKMTTPRYQDVKAAAIPEAIEPDGATARVIVGEFWGKTGPVEGVAAEPRYVDIWLPPGVSRRIPVERDRNVFAYVFAGSGVFGDPSAPRASHTAVNRSLVLFDTGDEIAVRAEDEGIRFLLASGKPLREPVAWYGPIVMNTQEELDLAFRELRNGTFIR
jgi:quercetin 2,3-dioxygenase